MTRAVRAVASAKSVRWMSVHALRMGQMATKSERAEFRVDDALRAKMRRAAQLGHEQQSELIRRAVFERAEWILAQN